MGSEEFLGQRASPNWHFCLHAELPFAKAQEGSSGSRHEWAYCEVAQGSFSASSCNHVQQCLSASSSVTRVFRTGSSLTRRSGLLQRRQSETPGKPQRNCGSQRVVFRLRRSLVDKGTERWAARSCWPTSVSELAFLLACRAVFCKGARRIEWFPARVG